MSPFDRPDEDVSFDLDTEAFSLEAILEEYRNYDPNAPEETPQVPASFAAHPVEAALVDEDAPEDDVLPYDAPEALDEGEIYDAPETPEDGVLENALDTEAEAAPDAETDEDADVREYHPHDGFTDEERQKWSEAKDSAVRLAKKGFSGIRDWVNRVTEPPEEEEYEEESSIPVSAPPEVPEGLYPEPPDDADEPTMVFHAVSDETEAAAFDDGTGDYAAPEAAETEDEPPVAPAHRSFREAVVNPVVSAIAVVSFRIRQHRTQVRAAAEAVEDLGPEPDAETAMRHYGGQIRALRLRCRLAWVVSLVLAYISLGFPVLGALDSSPTASALVCLVLQLTVMMLGLDVITSGAMALARRQPGLESLVVLSCVWSILDAVVIAVRGTSETELPFCGVSAVAVACCLWSALLTCRGYKMTFRALSVAQEPFAVSADGDVARDGITLLKSKRDTAGFIHRSEESGPAEAIYSVIAPYLIGIALVLGLLATILSGSWANIAHIFAAVTAPCAPFAALVAFALPYRTVARRLCRGGSALAGWSGTSDIGRSKHLIVTDKDIFPPQNVSISAIRTLDGVFPDKVVSCASSVIIASGSCLAPVFSELLRRNKFALLPVEEFTCNESGGLVAMVNGEEVMVGSSAFMSLKGIRLPQKLSAKNTVYAAINGLFVGYFVIEYTAVTSVQSALYSLLHSSLEPIFAVRDFNVTPLMLRQKFNMSTDGFDFPAYSRRYAMSAAEPGELTQIAGIVSRGGLGAFVSVCALGKRLYTAVQICVVLSLLCAAIGVVMMFLLCAMAAFDAATVGNLLAYLLLWLVPVILLNWGLRR